MRDSINEPNNAVFSIFNKTAFLILYTLKKTQKGLFSIEILQKMNNSNIKIKKSRSYNYLNIMVSNNIIKRGLYYKYSNTVKNGGFRYEITQFGRDFLELIEKIMSCT